jgi:hypothetical protein
MDFKDLIRATVIQNFEEMPTKAVEEITEQAALVLFECEKITGDNVMRVMTVIKVLNDMLQNAIKENLP